MLDRYIQGCRCGSIEDMERKGWLLFFDKGMQADPAAVAFETTKFAIDNQLDIAIIDTAGRLHTKINLMQELSKIKRSCRQSLR